MQDIKKNIPKSVTLKPSGQIRTMNDDIKEVQSPQDRVNLSNNIFGAKKESSNLDNEPNNKIVPNEIPSTNIPFILSDKENKLKTEINSLNNTNNNVSLGTNSTSNGEISKSDFQINLSQDLEIDTEYKISHKKELEEKSKELFGRKDNNLGDNLAFSKGEVPFSKNNSLDDNPLFKEMSIDSNPNSTIRTDDPTPIPNYEDNMSKKRNKTIYYIIGGLLVVVIIGGGVAFSLLRNTNDTTEQQADTTNQDIDDTVDDTSDGSVQKSYTSSNDDSGSSISANSLFPDTPTVAVTVNPSSIRSDIIAKISGLQEESIYLELKNPSGENLSLRDFASYMGITIPENILNNNNKWWTYVYKEQGLYKITNILEMNNNAIETFLEEWKSSISRNMSGYSLNSSSRGMTSSEPSKLVNILSSGKQISIYYYNYTTPSNSIDVGYIKDDKYIFISSSKFSMESLVKSFENK